MFNVKVSRKVKKEKKIGTNRIFSPEKLIRSYTSRSLHVQRQSFEKGKERKKNWYKSNIFTRKANNSKLYIKSSCSTSKFRER